ncbi:hypothetical protein C8C83_1728 [Flavobacterium sp. 90]|uniref:hypothetical protein n=1 Tax=unclassified Flavobacterium TaxID=196869 RepID=UPI000EAE0B9F|nr:MULTISPECIES: hypothetical protein [unclassified Flavobacterium]RKR10060.1 hypothetical protein C8C82_2030 [Flavobacterium sp. 81]TCK53845.1 hypothetical protein C8C83_1728 [Flavobacterium sp. 90]
MKNILKIFAVLYFILQPNIYSQQLVQTINDVYKLKDNEHLFINKPLNVLLKEIKPEIRTGSIINTDYTYAFCFRFTTITEQKNKEGEISDRVSIIVYVNKFIPWQWAQRSKGKQIMWTRDDEQEYGDLVVIHIDVVPAS